MSPLSPSVQDLFADDDSSVLLGLSRERPMTKVKPASLQEPGKRAEFCPPCGPISASEKTELCLKATVP